MFVKKIIITLFVCHFCLTVSAQSTVVGFSCQYEVIGDNPDNPEEVLIRVSSTSTGRCGFSLNAVDNFKPVVNDSCLIIPDPPCFERYYLNARDNAVFRMPKCTEEQLILLAVDRCCRDPDFTNVDVTSSNYFRRFLTNFTVSGKALASHNKSPVVADEIPTIFCKGAATVIQQPMTDEEGDQVIFRMASC